MADEQKESEETADRDPRGPAYKHLFESRQVPLFGAIDDKQAAKVIAQLLALEQEDPKAPITLLVNSPGGSVTDGFAIYDMMRFVEPEIRVICVGLAASAATIVLLGAAKEHRLSTPNAKFLIHQVFLPGVVRGQASDLEITAKDLIRTKERINKLYVEETGQPMERIEEDTNRDYWMTAEEAVEYGLIARTLASRSELGK